MNDSNFPLAFNAAEMVKGCYNCHLSPIMGLEITTAYSRNPTQVFHSAPVCMNFATFSYQR